MPKSAAQVELPDLRVLEEFGRVLLEADPSLVEDEAPVRDGQPLAGVLFDHQDARAELVYGLYVAEDLLDRKSVV